MKGPQKPLELILARNLVTSIGTPAFLVARDGSMLFYNEAAGALLGVPFEEVGAVGPDEWIGTFGPFDAEGNPIAIEDSALTVALRDGRPAHAHFVIRDRAGESHEIEASGMPIVGNAGPASGAIIFFWPVDEQRARELSTGRHRAVEP